jgi:hypothetical protein
MSGRGRGRGRGIPISYPDGWACKPVPSAEMPTWTPPIPFHMNADDLETLQLRRRLLKASALRVARVAVSGSTQDFVRYSDRYQDAPVQPFHKVRRCAPSVRCGAPRESVRLRHLPRAQSDMMTIKSGVHFPSELLPSRKAKQTRSGDAPADAPERKRLKKLSALDALNRLEASDVVGAEDEGEEEEDENEKGNAETRRHAADDDDEAPLTEEESDGDEMWDDAEVMGHGGYEDGGDDADDDGGGDDGDVY